MRKFYILLFLTNIFFISCSKKDADEFVAYPNNPLNDTVWVNQPSVTSPVYKIPELLSYTPTEDSFDVATGANIRVSQILNITFPSAGFTLANGTAVTGKVKVEVTHLHKRGDFIRFALQTVAFDKLLAAGGAFFIRVTKGGQELILDPTKSIILLVREPIPVNNLKVFYGEQVLLPPVPLAINSTFTWAAAADLNNVTVFNGLDGSGPFSAYQFNSKRLNWISCNSSLDVTNIKTRTTAVLPLNFTNRNTLVFAVLKDAKTVLQLDGHGNTKSFTIEDIPLNKDIILVSISKIGEEFYLGSKEIIVDKNGRASFTPVKKTKAAVGQFLDAL